MTAEKALTRSELISVLTDMMSPEFERIHERLDHVDQRLDQLEGRIDTVDTKVNTLNSTVSYLANEVKGLKAEFSTTPSQTAMDDLKVRVRKLEIATGDL